jgi:large subunit ribosomal protein L17
MPGTRKLGKPTAQRMAMLRQMVTDFIDYGKMETTVTRCKEIQPLVEKMITLGKRNTLHSRRQALKFIAVGQRGSIKEDKKSRQQIVMAKLFDELAPRYADRNGGYTRITRLGPRRGDGAEVAVIELV